MLHHFKSTFLNSDPFSSLLAILLHEQDCISLRRVSKHSLSCDTAPAAVSNLAWRAKLTKLFVVLEVCLRDEAPMPLSDLRRACAAHLDGADDAICIKQVLAVALGIPAGASPPSSWRGVLIELRSSPSGLALVPAFEGEEVEVGEGQERRPSLAGHMARLERFRATLARASESPAPLQELAERWVGIIAQPCEELASGQELQPKRRRLSRNDSVRVPMSAAIRAFEQSMRPSWSAQADAEDDKRRRIDSQQAHLRALANIKQACQRRIVLLAAHRACQHLQSRESRLVSHTIEKVLRKSKSGRALGGDWVDLDTVENVVRKLQSRKSHGSGAATKMQAKSAIALLLLKGSGWITAKAGQTSNGCRTLLRCAPGACRGVAQVACAEALERGLAKAEADEIDAEAAAQRAFAALF